MNSIQQELSKTTYPGRGILIGKSEDGKKAVIAYFIMGRSENSRNRIFVEENGVIKTQPFDPSKMKDPSLIIYSPLRVYQNATIVTRPTRFIKPFSKRTGNCTTKSPTRKPCVLLKKPCAREVLNRMPPIIRRAFPVLPI